MEKFIVRIPRTQENPFHQQRAAKPLKQMTIESLKGVVVFEDFDRAKLVLTRTRSSSQDKLDVLRSLAKKTPSAGIIASTGLGDILHTLSTNSDEEVAAEATRVSQYWRDCNLRKANRPSIEVRCDARTQKLRDAARRMIQDSLKSTLLAQTSHRDRKEQTGVKRKRGGDGEDDTCESLSARVDERLVSDVGCVVSQTSLGFSKGLRIDLDRYNSMMDSLAARGDSDSEDSDDDDDDDVLFCSESNSQDDGTRDSSQAVTENLLQELNKYLNSQNRENQKGVGAVKGSSASSNKTDKSLREENRGQSGKDRLLHGERQKHSDDGNKSKMKLSHEKSQEKKVRINMSNVSLPDKLPKNMLEGTNTDESYVGSGANSNCGEPMDASTTDPIKKENTKSENLPPRVRSGTHSKLKRRREEKKEQRHHKKIKIEPISSNSADEVGDKNLCSDATTKSVSTVKEEVRPLEHMKSLHSTPGGAQGESSSNLCVGEKPVCNALCETNLNEFHSDQRRKVSSKKKSHKKTKKNSKNKPEWENVPSKFDVQSATEPLPNNRKSKKHKTRHENAMKENKLSATRNLGDSRMENGAGEAVATVGLQGGCEGENSRAVTQDNGEKSVVISETRVGDHVSTSDKCPKPDGKEPRDISLETTVRENNSDDVHTPISEPPKGVLSSIESSENDSGHNSTLKSLRSIEGYPLPIPRCEPLRDEEDGVHSKSIDNNNDHQLEFFRTCNEKPSHLNSSAKEDEHRLILLNTSEVKGKEQENCPSTEPLLCDAINSKDVRKDHEDCTAQRSAKLKVSQRAVSESHEGTLGARLEHVIVKEEDSSDTFLSTSSEEPSSFPKASISVDDEPSPCSKEPSPCSKESSPCSKESSLCSKEPSLSSKESSPCSKEPSPCTKEPSPCTKEPSPCSKETSPSSKEPSPCSKEPSPCTKEPSPCSKEFSPCSMKLGSLSPTKKETDLTGKEVSDSIEKTDSTRIESSLSNKELGSSKKEYNSTIKESSSSKKQSSSSKKESTSSKKEYNSTIKESSSSSKKQSSSSKKESNSSKKESSSSKKESSSSKKELSSSKKESSFSKKESSSSKKQFGSSKKESSSSMRESNSSKKESSSSKEESSSSKKESSSSKKESSSSKKESSSSKKQSSSSKKEYNFSMPESNSSKKESSSSKQESCSSDDPTSSKKKGSSHSRDSNSSKKETSSFTTPSASASLASSSKSKPLDQVEAAMLSETIERELFQGTRRLVNKRYKQAVRRLVFALKHQDKIRRKVIAGKVTVGSIVRNYMQED